MRSKKISNPFNAISRAEHFKNMLSYANIMNMSDICDTVVVMPYINFGVVYLHFLSFQQPPVGCYLHLQVLFDAQQLLIVGLVALHVQA